MAHRGFRASEEPTAYMLRDYALLADGERGILVGPRGEFCWMCAPRWDSEAVFSSLLGGPGVYAVSPRQRCVWAGSYEAGSLIWTCRWTTTSGVIECREALAFPGDPATAVILRRVFAREGDASIRLVCDPRPGFGGDSVSAPRITGPGIWEATGGELGFRWSGWENANVTDGRLELDLTVPAGCQHDLVLEIGRPAEEPVNADEAWRATEDAWRRASPHLETIADHDALHAYMVMRGLTSGTGGMVAAATTSLPEGADAGRDHDHRYVWIRDQCQAGQAAAAAGANPLLDDAVRFVATLALTDGPRMSPAYTVQGGPVPEPREVDLPGYPGGTHRIGSRVSHRFQLAAFGDALLLFAAAARHDRLGTDAEQAVRVVVAAIEARWTEPDAGIWDLEDRAWTQSRLNCAAGLRAIVAHATGQEASRWSALADTIVADTAVHATHPSGWWQRAADDPRLDGALLLAPVRGAVPSDDARSLRTLKAYVETLTDDGYAYRFQQDERPLGQTEGTFLPCGLLLALALHQQGDRGEALRWFDRNRTVGGPARLLTEEYDAPQRLLSGDLPRALTHAFLLEAAARLTEDSSGHPMVG